MSHPSQEEFGEQNHLAVCEPGGLLKLNSLHCKVTLDLQESIQTQGWNRPMILEPAGLRNPRVHTSGIWVTYSCSLVMSQLILWDQTENS